MGSAIQLNCGYLPITSPGISSTIGIRNVTKFQQTYNRTSTSLSCISRHQATPALSQVPRKGYSFSGIFSNGNYKRKKSTSITAQMQLVSAKKALKTLLGMSKYLATRESGNPNFNLKVPDQKPSVKDVEILKKYALWLIKSGKPSTALEKLEAEYKKYKDTEPEIAYFLDLALVEIYICLGKYKQAAERNCVQVKTNDPLISDSRIPLYKAILHTILGENEKAQQWWEKFMETVGDGGLSSVLIEPRDEEDEDEEEEEEEE